MTFQQLVYFTTVVKYNSITKAAKNLFVSQPTISLSIKELEEEFETTLFHRNNNQLSLTPEGKYLNSLALNLLSEYENVTNKFNKYLKKSEILRVGIPPMLGTFIFPPIIDEFSKNHPHVQMQLTGIGSVANIRAVENREIDIALTVVTPNQELSKNIDYVKVDETSLLFSVDKSHKLAKRKVITAKDIGETPLILMHEDTLQSKLIQEEFKKYNINPVIQIRTNQLYTIKELLAYGKLGAFLFSQMINEDDNVIGIPFEEEIKLDIILAWNKDAFLTDIAKSFIEFMKRK